MRSALLFAVLLVLPGCATSSQGGGLSPDGLSRARLGETVPVGGPRVTPLGVLEDSRCPTNVHCVRAGEVRLSVRIDLGSGSQIREVTQGRPISVADGMLELVEVRPDKTTDTIAPKDYRFGLRFMGGL